MGEYKISIYEIKKICENNEAFSDIKTLAQLKDFFSQKKTKGLWLKDIMKEVGVADAKIPPEKQSRIDWIIRHIQIEGLMQEESSGLRSNIKMAASAVKLESRTQENGLQHEQVLCRLSRKEVSKFLMGLRSDCFQNKDGVLDLTEAKIYEGISVEYQDNFCVMYQPGYYEGLVAVLKKDVNEAVAVGHLRKENRTYHIILDCKNIDYEMLGQSKKYRLALFDLKDQVFFQKTKLEKSDAMEFQGKVSTITCTIDYRPMKVSRNTLCIDFGTSNTAAGTYGILEPDKNEVELVSFIDVSAPQLKKTQMYPTLVYVDNCKDADDIKYLFGYEASKKVTDRGYDTEASVFFEIKRWVSSLNEEEELRDEEGNAAVVKRQDIMKAYILHVIHLSEQYFKHRFQKLHLSAPVRLKEKFYREMKKMLNGQYQILPTESSVDEGIAIVYNSISELVRMNRISENKKTSIMILDCGGGTTDLASCEVSAKDISAGKKLKITTKFVNGNSNFGGNNITFRVLQMLKIKLAEQYDPEFMGDCDLKTLIPYEESDVLDKVEKSYRDHHEVRYNSDTKNSIYEQFVKAYERAEQVIPTIFKDNERFQFVGQQKKIKRNYYYLWQLAEKIKIKFYAEEKLSIDFRIDRNEPLEFDRMENYYLYIVEENSLVKKENPAEKVEITINEIRKALCGDIYGLLNELLAQEVKIDNYEYYRLAGQSCKINLFKDLLKEFIPGRKLRTSAAFKRDENEEEINGSIRLKLDCIKGSIAYIRDKECGKIKPEMSTDSPKLIYDVYINKVDDELPILSKDDPNLLKYAVYSNKAARAEFLIKNSFGKIERKIVIELGNTVPKEIELSVLFTEVKNRGIIGMDLLADLQDRIIAENPADGDEKRFLRIVFAIPSKEGYGMTIYRILKEVTGERDIYHQWPPIYENYENESSKSFFDGRR